VSAPRCVLIGAGRMAGGFVAPLLREAGWEVVLACRNRVIARAINEGGGFWMRTFGKSSQDHWIGGIGAVSLHDPALIRLGAGADLLATAVGASALHEVGRTLAPLLCARLAASDRPINIITFENHRRAPELLTFGLIEARASLAPKICRRVGIGGAAVWRTISRRTITSEGIRFDADGVGECYADGVSLLPDAAPLDGSIPRMELVRGFDDRMVEKLWLYNAGHAAAAYLGWQHGCQTISAAMERPDIRGPVSEVVTEAQWAFEAYLGTRPGSAPINPRPLDSILGRYADTTLQDPVVRVAREPRRKLAADDRLMGPSIACLSAGIRPVALAGALADALSYGEAADPQAVDLQREIGLLGPKEVLAEVGTLDPQDELVRLVCDAYVRRSISVTLPVSGIGGHLKRPRRHETESNGDGWAAIVAHTSLNHTTFQSQYRNQNSVAG
jgi:mannitol-1-phosphate 5-dehydrogenase